MLSSNVAEAVAMVHTEPGLAGPDIEILLAAVPFLDHGFTVRPATVSRSRRSCCSRAAPARSR